jgi:hypothetical protein
LVSAGKLKENDLKYWFPVIELVLIFTQINIFIKIFFQNQYIGNKHTNRKAGDQAALPSIKLLE